MDSSLRPDSGTSYCGQKSTRRGFGLKVIFILDYLRNNAENNKQWQDLQLLQDKNLGYSYGNNPLDDSGLGGMISNGMDESVQSVSIFLIQFFLSVRVTARY